MFRLYPKSPNEESCPTRIFRGSPAHLVPCRYKHAISRHRLLCIPCLCKHILFFIITIFDVLFYFSRFLISYKTIIADEFLYKGHKSIVHFPASQNIQEKISSFNLIRSLICISFVFSAFFLTNLTKQDFRFFILSDTATLSSFR